MACRCRICCDNKSNLIDIFDEKISNGAMLKNYILVATDVEIKEDDTITKLVCAKCLKEAYHMFQFRSNAIINDKNLKNHAGQPFVPPNPTFYDPNNPIIQKFDTGIAIPTENNEPTLKWTSISNSGFYENMPTIECRPSTSYDEDQKNDVIPLLEKADLKLKECCVVLERFKLNTYKVHKSPVDEQKKTRTHLPKVIHSSVKKMFRKYPNLQLSKELCSYNFKPCVKLEINEDPKRNLVHKKPNKIITEARIQNPTTKEVSITSCRPKVLNNKYICRVCNQLFDREFSLITHMGFHPYCKFCNDKFIDFKSLKRHKSKPCPVFNSKNHLQIRLERCDKDVNLKSKYKSAFTDLISISSSQQSIPDTNTEIGLEILQNDTKNSNLVSQSIKKRRRLTVRGKKLDQILLSSSNKATIRCDKYNFIEQEENIIYNNVIINAKSDKIIEKVPDILIDSTKSNYKTENQKQVYLSNTMTRANQLIHIINNEILCKPQSYSYTRDDIGIIQKNTSYSGQNLLQKHFNKTFFDIKNNLNHREMQIERDVMINNSISPRSSDGIQIHNKPSSSGISRINTKEGFTKSNRGSTNKTIIIKPLQLIKRTEKDDNIDFGTHLYEIGGREVYNGIINRIDRINMQDSSNTSNTI